MYKGMVKLGLCLEWREQSSFDEGRSRASDSMNGSKHIFMVGLSKRQFKNNNMSIGTDHRKSI